jgi:hypothetical protein
MNRGNPNNYVREYLSSKPPLVIFAISSSPEEDVPSPHARRHLLPDKEFKSHRSASPKSPELEPTISKGSRVDTVGLSTPRVLKVTPYPTWDISQLPEDQRLKIIKKRDELLNKREKSVITISDLQASSGSSASNSFSGSSILNATMYQETEVSRREEAPPNNTRNEVTGTLVYATEEIPQILSPAGFLLRPEGSQVQKEKQSCFSGCIIS